MDENKKKKISFGAWIWTCIKVCVVIVMFPLVIGALGFLASIFLPICFIAVPVMVVAFVWLILS